MRSGSSVLTLIRGEFFPWGLHLSDLLIDSYTSHHLFSIRNRSTDYNILRVSSRVQHLFICEGEEAPAWKGQTPEAEAQKSLA